MDIARAKSRVGRRALRVPVSVPAARRSLTTRDVRQLVDDQCFLPSASGRIGVEVEWLAVCHADQDQPVVPELVGEAGAELPAGSRLTFEPDRKSTRLNSSHVRTSLDEAAVEHAADATTSRETEPTTA